MRACVGVAQFAWVRWVVGLGGLLAVGWVVAFTAALDRGRGGGRFLVRAVGVRLFHCGVVKEPVSTCGAGWCSGGLVG